MNSTMMHVFVELHLIHYRMLNRQSDEGIPDTAGVYPSTRDCLTYSRVISLLSCAGGARPVDG